MKEPTVQKSIELAMETERQGARFYERMAKKFAEQADLAMVFKQLAADERVHEAKFKDLIDSAPEDPITAHQYGRDEYLRAIAISEFLRADHFAELDKADDLADVLLAAIGMEKATLVFYQGIKDAIGGHPALDAVIQEEKKHIVSLFERLEKIS